MNAMLGIDTGGTYTDAVLVEQTGKKVLFSAKTLTTYDDLTKGLGRAVDAVLGHPSAPGPESINMVGLSTTLATNAIVENRGGRIALILIGYSPELIRAYDLSKELVADKVVHIAGGHTYTGDEASPLDLSRLRELLKKDFRDVEGFGVTSYYSVRNPAHELTVKDLIQEMTGLPVTCGHELTSKLDSIRRATTVALNARLIVLIRELIDAVLKALAARNISAPLMMVRGDGSLVDAAWASRRPIETILSGPAASIMGAKHLVGAELGEEQSFWVLDMGGTTTDVAFLDQGLPRLSQDGARVGGWRTMVEAVDIQTVGLGGDSHVRCGSNGRLQIGPRRVVPLSQLAADNPEIEKELERQVKSRLSGPDAAVFFLPQAGRPKRPSEWEAKWIELASSGPVAWSSLERREGFRFITPQTIDHAVGQRLVGLSAFTPTDALHVLDNLRLWPKKASELAAELLADQARMPVEEFCRQVAGDVSFGLAKVLVSAALTAEGTVPGWETEPVALKLLNKALKDSAVADHRLSCSFRLNHPLAAIGAPVLAYTPEAAKHLQTRIVIPAHSEVANAVGAVAGGVVLRRTVEIRPLSGSGRYRLHLDDGLSDFDDLETAVSFAVERMTVNLKTQVEMNRARSPRISYQRRDINALAGAAGDEIVYLGTELHFLARGDPSQPELNLERPCSECGEAAFSSTDQNGNP